MIKNPLALICVLIVIEALILYLSGHPRFEKCFRFFPAVFWMYFLPMVLSTLGWIDSQSPVYKHVSKYLLPASLLLLLIVVDLKAILYLGKPALIMMFAGSAGIMLGVPSVFFIFKRWVGEEMWSGFAALSGSWTGGSANMIAVKEALTTPEHVFTPMVVVDAIVPYVWMGILVALVGLQPLFDRWNESDRRILDELGKKIENDSLKKHNRLSWQGTVIVVLVACLGSWAANAVAGFLPEIKNMISTYAWTVILVSLMGTALSLTPARRLEDYGAPRIGYYLLYFVLTTIGAKASLADIGSTAILVAAGFLIVLIHAVVIFITARIIKAPMFLAATASQANIGGVASAPVIAELYQPGLASVGLLLAILGNIIGTYLGIMTGQLCRFVAGI